VCEVPRAVPGKHEYQRINPPGFEASSATGEIHPAGTISAPAARVLDRRSTVVWTKGR
jgi:hypothetical protein